MGTDCRRELFLQANLSIGTKIDRLSMTEATLTTSGQTHLTLKRRSQVSDKQQIGRSQQLLIKDGRRGHGFRETHNSSRARPVLSFSLILPSWLVQYSLQISVFKAAQTWTLNLKPYRTVPHNSELLAAIESGDFDKLHCLIDSSQATVFDREEHGLTALHV